MALEETALPPSARNAPDRSVNRPPASSTMTLLAARSHSATCGSTTTSTEPSATSMCCQKSPNALVRQQRRARARNRSRSEEHTSELQSRRDLVCRLLLEKKKQINFYVLLLKKKEK